MEKVSLTYAVESVKAKPPRGDGRELVHISRWRLANILMMHDMEYARKKAMDGIISFVDGWTPRVPEPAGAPPPKEKPEALADQGTKKDRREAACDPTALGQDLEKAKEAAKEREPQEIVAGDGKKVFPNEPRGSVGTLLEKKAAERREELRKKEKERRKKSRGRSRSRKIRKGNKRKGESSSERRHIREPGGVRSAPDLRRIWKETIQKNKKLWGVPMRIRELPYSKEKSLQRARRAEKLGAVVDGDSGTLTGSTKRALDSLSLVFWLLGHCLGCSATCGRTFQTVQPHST